MGGSSKSGRSLQLSDWLAGTINALTQALRLPLESELDIKQTTAVLASQGVGMNERRAVIGVVVGAVLEGHAPRGLDLENQRHPRGGVLVNKAGSRRCTCSKVPPQLEFRVVHVRRSSAVPSASSAASPCLSRCILQRGTDFLCQKNVS